MMMLYLKHFYFIFAFSSSTFVKAQNALSDLYEASNTNSINVGSTIEFETNSGVDSTVMSKKPHAGNGMLDEIELTVNLISRDLFGENYQPQLVLFFAPASTAVEDVTTTDNGFTTYFEASTVAWMKEKTHKTINRTWFSFKTLSADGTRVSENESENIRMETNGALRLKRSNGKVTAHYSFDDGNTWTQIGFDYELPEEYRTAPLKIGYRVLREFKDQYRFSTLPEIVSGGEVDLASTPEEPSYFDGTNTDVDSSSCTVDGCSFAGTSNVAVMLSTAVFVENIAFTIHVKDRQIFGTGYQARIQLFFAPETSTITDVTTLSDEAFKNFAVASIKDKIYYDTENDIDHTWMTLQTQTASGSLEQTGGDNYKNIDGYIKLERVDGTIKAWMSPNGNAWKQIGVDQALPPNLGTARVKIGLRILKVWSDGYEMTLMTKVESPATPIPYSAYSGSCGVPSGLGLKCAHLAGDPHLSTYDGVRYDCQGRGEFILAQNNHLSIQGRFMPPHPNRQVTVMRSVAFSMCSGPVIQVSVPEEVPATTCSFKYHLDGIEVDLAALPSVKTRNSWLFFEEKESRTLVSVGVYHSHAFGCMMAQKVCIPGETEGTVGLFGTPNGQRADDWTISSDNQATVPAEDDWDSLLYQPAYDYCMNWCVGSLTSSLFQYNESGGKDMAYYNIDCPVTIDEDPEPYDDSIERELENVPNNITEVCGDNIQCQIEGVFGGVEDTVILELSETDIVDVELIQRELYDKWELANFTDSPTAAPDTPTAAPVTASVSGDPHFKTWAGEAFDFHGICDLVLLTNKGFKEKLGMDIHIRTKKTKSWSYISNAVLRIGEETLEVMGEKNGSGRHWINSVAGNEGIEEGFLQTCISGFPIIFQQVHSKQKVFTVDLGQDGMIGFKTWKEMVRVDINGVGEENFGSSGGMLGTYSIGTKVARDGKTILNDLNAFGQEWQVLATEPKLFHNIEGPQQPEKCALPTVTERRRHLREGSITQEDAEHACVHASPEDFDYCVFDVMAIGDLSVSGAY